MGIGSQPRVAEERMVVMPARIVMMNGDKFVVDMGVDLAANKFLVGEDPHAQLDAEVGGGTKTVFVMRAHIAYVEDYRHPEPMVAMG
jgi:hypothetical protein